MLRTPSTARIRVGRPADAADVAAVFRDSWQLAYTGILPEPYLSRLLAARDATWWGRALRSSEAILVLDVAGTLAGYATFGRARTACRFKGEIYELYLAPVYQGCGYGEHLFEACRAKLDQHKISGLLVWALAENTQAADFYHRRGGRPVGRQFELMGRQRVAKVAFGWP
jgi:GNAT superfamily N-acetyltransferase